MCNEWPSDSDYHLFKLQAAEALWLQYVNTSHLEAHFPAAYGDALCGVRCAVCSEQIIFEMKISKFHRPSCEQRGYKR